MSRHNGDWQMSFNYAVELPGGAQEPMPEEKLLEYFSGLTVEELEAITLAGDRGVTISMATSSGVNYDFTETEKARLLKAKKKRKKLQRKLSVQHVGSKCRHDTKDKIGKTHTHEGKIREDRAYKTSRAIVESDAQVFVFEDLQVQSMTKRAKPGKDDSGKYFANGVAARSGLNEAILESMWGDTVKFTKHKGLKKEKLKIKIHPSGTSGDNKPWREGVEPVHN